MTAADAIWHAYAVAQVAWIYYALRHGPRPTDSPFLPIMAAVSGASAVPITITDFMNVITGHMDRLPWLLFWVTQVTVCTWWLVQWWRGRRPPRRRRRRITSRVVDLGHRLVPAPVRQGG